MSAQHAKAPGHVSTPALLSAMAGTGLAIGFAFMGYFHGLDAHLEALWEREPFLLIDGQQWPAYYNWVGAFIFSWMVALGVLDSAHAWRRVLIAAMAMLVTVGLSPTLMLWGVFWSPSLLAVAVLWTWFCAFVYASQHAMPCENAVQTVQPTSAPPEPPALPEGFTEDALPSAEPEVNIHVETITFPVKEHCLPKEQAKYQPKPSKQAAAPTSELNDDGQS